MKDSKQEGQSVDLLEYYERLGSRQSIQSICKI